MLRFYALCFVIFNSVCFTAQTFTWMKGTNTGGQIGLYGTQGVASATNNPGCRHGSATWIDNQGNLWLFGGEGYSNNNTLCWLNDLWKYDVVSNEWTWISGANTANQPGVYGTMGVPSSNNYPGAREFMMSWTDATGNFWLFGGEGFAANANFGKLGDLWRYNPTTSQWTWMKGFNVIDQNGVYGTQGLANAGNVPGSRNASGTWVDASGNLWLFGGRGLPATGAFTGFLNDLWRYSISTNQWTWMGGSNLISQSSVYGTLNMGSALNIPGGMEFPSCWFNNGELYLFGGRGLPGVGPPSYLNTLWKYSIVLNQWIWIGGSTNNMTAGIYGTLGVASSTNMPGARMSAASWNDGAGNLWLFGGEGIGSSPGLGPLNDLFRYTISNGEWTWIKGSDLTNQLGSYGTQGVSSATNVPGGRYYNTWWPNSNGKCWLIGGYGYSNINTADNMEDLWKFVPSCQPESISSLPSSTLCSGNTITLSALANGSNSVSWFGQAIGGIAIGSGTQLINSTANSTLVANVNIFYAESANCTSYPRTPISVTVYGQPVVNVSGTSSICPGDTYSLNASGNGITYTWSTGSNSSSISNTLNTTSSFTVSSSNIYGCISHLSGISVSVHPQILLSIAGNNSICIGNTLTLNATGNANTFTWSTGSSASSIAINPSNNVTITLIGEDLNGCSTTSSLGISVLELPIISIQSKSVICVGEQTTLTASGALTYVWSNGQTLNPISVSPISSINYSVIGTANNSCTNSAQFNLLVSECTKLDDFYQNNENIPFNAYPNPSSGSVHLTFGKIINGKVLIYNTLGQQVFSELVTTNKMQIQLSEGVYLCVLYADKKPIRTIKLLVE